MHVFMQFDQFCSKDFRDTSNLILNRSKIGPITLYRPMVYSFMNSLRLLDGLKLHDKNFHTFLHDLLGFYEEQSAFIGSQSFFFYGQSYQKAKFMES